MRAEAISLTVTSEVQALNPNKNATGVSLGGDFLVALMSALIQPQVIGSLAAPMDAGMLEQQTQSPEEGDVLSVSPWVKIVAVGGNSVLPDSDPFLTDGPKEVIMEKPTPGSVMDYQQSMQVAEVGMAPDNQVNSFIPGPSIESPANYYSIEGIDSKSKPAETSEGVNIVVSGPKAEIEGKMRAVAPEVSELMTESQDMGTERVVNKEVSTPIPVSVRQGQSGDQSQIEIAFRHQSPEVESWSTSAQITAAKGIGTVIHEAETVDVGLSSSDPVSLGEIQRPDSQGRQDAGEHGEKERPVINKDQTFKTTANDLTFAQEGQKSSSPSNGQGMPVKQADSVKIAEGKPPVAGVFSQEGQGKTEEAVNRVDKAQGVTAENADTVGFQEQSQVNTGTINLSNITPRKFPSEIMPYLMNPVRSMNGDGRVTIIRLKLEPENMGEIKIRISYAKGKMAAHFITSSGIVREAIESSLPQLKETLAQYKVDLGEAAAFVGQEQQNHGFGSKGFGHNGRMKGFTGMFSGGEAGDKTILTGAGDDQKVNLLI